ncbi:MAG: hypothetical protein ACI4O5_05030 [Oscillospiraceae bacterium]
MRKFLAWRQGIPRPVRIVRNIVLAVVLLFLFYVFCGCPDMTAEQAYRRAEERNLVGPGEILGILDVNISGGYDRLLLAETDAGVVQFCYRYENLGFLKGHSFSSYEGNLIYREKEGVVTLMAATGEMYHSGPGEKTLPLILFDDCPKAVRAELDLRLTGTYNSSDYDYTYHLDAQRTAGGYFAFDLISNSKTEKENFAISQVSGLYAQSGGAGEKIPAAVRLYSQFDELIYEGEATLRSAAGEAHARRELENP